MQELLIQLSQDYKSFTNWFNYTFRGDLIIISGVNGSGKSQLFDIIRRKFIQKDTGQSTSLAANIWLNWVYLDPIDIIYRSFKENITAPDLSLASAQNIVNHKNNVFSQYQNNRLDENHPQIWDYKNAAREAKTLLIKHFWESIFWSGTLTQSDVYTGLPDSFIWRTDDIFTNFIWEIFFNYTLKVRDYEAKCCREKKEFDIAQLDMPPRQKLNNLFEYLNISYRFANDYNVEWININKQPELYYIDNMWTIDYSHPRSLRDLSDGEKAIISFTFWSLISLSEYNHKLLLLDEFDATFNPSLTEMFFKVIDKYFVSQGIQTIIITHSSATISLAPDNATFYEIFKPNNSWVRILEVNKDNYNDMKLAHKRFYDQILDSNTRITQLSTELIDQKKNFEDEVKKLISSSHKPLIITEWKSDVKIFQKALLSLNINDLDVIWSDLPQKDEWRWFANLEKLLLLLKTDMQPRKVIGIFDRDSWLPQKLGTEDTIKDFGNNVYAFCIPKPSHRDFDDIQIEHYFSDLDMKKTDSDERRLFLWSEFHQKSGKSIDWIYQTDMKNKCWKSNTIIDQYVYKLDDLQNINSLALSKDDFAEAVSKWIWNFSNIDFSNFTLIFNKIKEIINLPTVENPPKDIQSTE